MRLAEEVGVGAEVPRHVAIIMDGNGRWAHRRGRPRAFGHRAGMAAARRAMDAAIEAGVEVLTLFAFSDQNWQRPWSEISALMSALELNARRHGAGALQRKGVSVRALGDLERLPFRVRSAIEKTVESTRGGTTLCLNVAISYGARAEIAGAARRLAERVETGRLTAAEIDETLFASQLDTGGLPDPDLLIRTSGERRISNFLLWQLAYAELYFSPVLWPDFSREHLFEAIRDYQRRERRFGRLASA